MLFTFGSAASKDDGIDRDTFWSFPGWVHDGALASRDTKARVRMCTGFLVTKFPGLSQPGGYGDTRWKRLVNAFPVHTAITGLSHVGEKSVTLDCGHGIGIGGSRGTRGHPEEAILGVDGPELTCQK